jgi:hypothetical protein
MTKRALLVGLDQYPDPRNNLNSCVADTLAFRNNVLIGAYGFDPADIQLLHNSDANLANVRAGLDRLFASAQPGDEIVYFESSHGYRYPNGDTLVEVLCLYDGFLEDTEFVARSAKLPPDVFTAVLDACHSGGMDKVFFPPGGTAVARAKVFQPDTERARLDAQLLHQVTNFKFFGKAVTGDTGAVAKQFRLPPATPSNVPAPKDMAAAQVELNGALFAACMADQTAAAGSPMTNNLSAFTFALVDQLDPTISLAALQAKVATRLAQLNMSQTPVIDVPVLHPELAAEAFISMRAAGMHPALAANGVPAGVDADAWNRVFGPLAA